VSLKGHYKNNADGVVDDVDAEDRENRNDTQAPSYYVTTQEQEGKQTRNSYGENYQEDEDIIKTSSPKTKGFLAVLLRYILST